MKKALLLFAALLVAGCGENSSSEGSDSTGEKPTAPIEDVKPVEEKQQEVKPEEPLAETKPKLEGVNYDEFELRERIAYLKGSDTPYTGKAFGLYENGQKQMELNFKDGKENGLCLSWHENGQKQFESTYKDGKQHGLVVTWHENGQKQFEANLKDGKLVGSEKFWNSKGRRG